MGGTCHLPLVPPLRRLSWVEPFEQDSGSLTPHSSYLADPSHLGPYSQVHLHCGSHIQPLTTSCLVAVLCVIGSLILPPRFVQSLLLSGSISRNSPLCLPGSNPPTTLPYFFVQWVRWRNEFSDGAKVLRLNSPCWIIAKGDFLGIPLALIPSSWCRFLTTCPIPGSFAP